jgi:hypothetical protein
MTPNEPSDARYDLDLETEPAWDWRERQAELEAERADSEHDWRRDDEMERG